MTLQQLEYIVSLERLRHFGKAADACRVSQPTLSAMVQKLEAELGVTLFERSARSVTPTPLGMKVVRQAQQVLYAAEGVRELVSEEQASLGGTFTLGILPTIAPYLLPRFFPRLCKEFPDLDLRVVEMKTADLRAALESHELDAAVLVDLGDVAPCTADSLYFEQFVAYVARHDQLFRHDRIKTSDLADEPLWLLGEGHCFRDQLVRFCHLKAARKSQSVYHLGSIETFMRMVESGQGVTFLPELALYQLTAEQKALVRPFAIPIPTREIVLLTPPHFVRHAVRRLLVQAIRESVPERMHHLNNTQQRV